MPSSRPSGSCSSASCSPATPSSTASTSGPASVHLIVARTDLERRQVLNAIGPVWDGNEVWLITAGGAVRRLPARLRHGLLGLLPGHDAAARALILRGSRSSSAARRRQPGGGPAGTSASPSGRPGGAALRRGARQRPARRPLDADGVYRGGLVGLLNPFSLVVGVLTLALAAQQGSAWLVLKTEGELAERARKVQLGGPGRCGRGLGRGDRVWRTPVRCRGLRQLQDEPGRLGRPAAGRERDLLRVRATLLGQPFRAFLCSSLTIAFLAITAATALYPNLVPAVDGARA
jgi:hypothetical protein